MERRTLGEEHQDTLGTKQNLASVYQEDGKYKEAEPLANKTQIGRASCRERV